MKAFAFLIAVAIAASVLVGPGMAGSSLSVSQGPTVTAAANNTTAPAKLQITVDGDTINGQPRFTVEEILVPVLPIVVNVTFRNIETLGDGVDHTFSMRNANGTIVLNSGLISPQNSTSLEFTVNSLTSITYNGTTFQPQQNSNGTIHYFCIPHETLGMIGDIGLGSAPPVVTPPPGTDTLVRAFFIGLVAFAVMLVWIAISYLIVRSPKARAKSVQERERERGP